MNKLPKFLRRLENIYNNEIASKTLRTTLLEPLLTLASFYRDHGTKMDVLRTVQRLLISLDFVVDGWDATNKVFKIHKWGFMFDQFVGLFLLARTAFLNSFLIVHC